GDQVELAELYRGLDPGRMIIVAGERNDIAGVNDAEVVSIASVDQQAGRLLPATSSGTKVVPLPGDKTHTFLTLNPPLVHRYERKSVTIYANVVRATHGETRNEVLGSGNPRDPLQSFKMQQFPLTFVSAATGDGAASTLEVRVNDVLWHEAP